MIEFAGQKPERQFQSSKFLFEYLEEHLGKENTLKSIEDHYKEAVEVDEDEDEDEDEESEEKEFEDAPVRKNIERLIEIHQAYEDNFNQVESEEINSQDSEEMMM